MRLLLTGATGLVGAAIASRFAGAGAEVVGLARNVPPGPPAYRVVSCDIGDPAAVDALDRAVGRCNVVVHTAATLEHSLEAVAIAQVNCTGTQAIAALAGRWGAESFVYTSSIGVIGLPSELPVTEDHPVRPKTAYHGSKAYGETVTSLLAERGVQAISMRLTAPVGREMPAGRILPVFVARASAGAPISVAGEGSRGQDYLSVEDIAEATWAAVDAGVSGLFNIGSGRVVTNLELARQVVDQLDSTSEIRTGEAPDDEDGVRWEVSIEKAATAFGFAPRVGIDQSIRELAERHAGSARS